MGTPCICGNFSNLKEKREVEIIFYRHSMYNDLRCDNAMSEWLLQISKRFVVSEVNYES
jgi:hypothetical protein